MDQFRLAIAVMAATDSQWGPRDADGRRREFTAAELDALVDFGWHWPDLKGAMAACANAVRSRWQRRGGNSVVSPRSLAPPSILRWTERRETQMSTSRRTRITIPTFGAVLLFALAAPIAVNADEVIAAEEQILAAAPAAPSWDETSGYGSVEASRAAAFALLAPVAGPSWDETSGYGSVEASRATMPIAVDAEDASAPQTITIHDERTGDGPCGFLVERTVDGTVALVPSIDVAGNLILAIEPVTLHGTLSNPATGKSVELRWVRSNGVVDFGYDGTTTTVALALDGHFFRGYDGGRTDLTMMLPVDGAERLAFEAGQRSADPWSHVCGLLA